MKTAIIFTYYYICYYIDIVIYLINGDVYPQDWIYNKWFKN